MLEHKQLNISNFIEINKYKCEKYFVMGKKNKLKVFFYLKI